jgi:hypothetical protein
MATQPKVSMTMRDLDRLKCIQGVIDGELKVYQAAERLGITPRQVLRLVRRYELEGPIGLICRHRNRPSNHRIKPHRLSGLHRRVGIWLRRDVVSGRFRNRPTAGRSRRFAPAQRPTWSRQRRTSS